jgi:2-polyprenyl-6-methoxyphenol hydroxylase-like FAD-dependent oxidoreductase
VNSWDVIIAGAGIIGVSLALELRERGATVLVLDQGERRRPCDLWPWKAQESFLTI